ncbi:MAG: DUF2089 domain-containing protein [Planctomycetes bacterium]|nr:DUF2089 domain-containing protein [Planctomycetota bacterium]
MHQTNRKRGEAQALEGLDDADREFVTRFVLASGSLKDVAQSYGVSYPTIRARLDRLIARFEELRRGQPVNPVAELLARLVEKGEMSPSAAQRVLAEHRKEVERQQEK